MLYGVHPLQTIALRQTRHRQMG